MTDQQKLNTLREARALLDSGYIKGRTRDGKGGYCAYGALIMANEGRFNDVGAGDDPSTEELLLELSKAATVLFPVFTCHYALISVNNSTDKASTLSVFDSAILSLELKLSPPIAPEPELVEV
jgi:hypothetical protein